MEKEAEIRQCEPETIEKVRAHIEGLIPDLEAYNEMDDATYFGISTYIEEEFGTEYLEVLQVYVQEIHGV